MTVNKSDIKTALLALVAAVAFIAAAVVSVAPAASRPACRGADAGLDRLDRSPSTSPESREKEPQQSGPAMVGPHGA